MISIWPNASEVSEEHRNNIIITNVYTYDADGNEKVLRIYPSDIACEELKEQQKVYYRESYPVFPLSFYKPDVYFIKLVDNYQALKEDKLTEEQLKELPKDTVVFKRF